MTGDREREREDLLALSSCFKNEKVSSFFFVSPAGSFRIPSSDTFLWYLSVLISDSNSDDKLSEPRKINVGKLSVRAFKSIKG